MLMIMLVFAVIAASAGYFVRSFSNQTNEAKGSSLQLVFFLFTLAAPLLLMVVLSVVRQIIAWLGRPR